MAVTIDRPGIDRLLQILQEHNYEVIGPTVAAGTITYDAITSSADLPVGLTDRQGPGSYRLEERDDEALFGYVVGQRSWKHFLIPPEVPVWIGRLDGTTVETMPRPDPPRYAFFGVRPCDLAALGIHDRVFLDGPVVEDTYATRRERALIVAVNCTEPAPTCFCTSVDGGPMAGDGHDIVITELLDGGHRFVVDAGSPLGEEIVAELGAEAASEDDITLALDAVTEAAQRITRHLDTNGLEELLYANATSRHWGEVASRCLSCANCTMVCPTCFCATYDDDLSLDGRTSTRTRRWDSCFAFIFSYIHGGSVRTTPSSRYRQWMTHKLASWQDQYGVIGCVGCGRCITWCPVGIDITAEAAAIRASDIREPGAARDLEEVRT